MNSRITTDQISELLAQDKSGRVTRELLQAFLRNPQGQVNDKLQDYHVTVDYGMTVEQMVEAGRYDWKNSDVSSRNFQVKGEGLVEVNLELVHLNKVASTSEAKAYLDANGLRAATIEELLAFGATFPDVQREFPIVALGSSWVDRYGDRDVPCLDRRRSKRRLDLYWHDYRWDGFCRFLAVRN
ncbi:MAG: hypothetical protein GW939_03370 [Candidatus Magasanikbacteria bacterium]|nr:hypothetical protein [Candidatus Magasanikbacteria bacterium]NCS71671.1 hypothetical protein [Candidatus Magasanikbacteria bacterium]